MGGRQIKSRFSLLLAMSNPLRIAVVGSGIGVEHIKGYRELPELFDLKILCDVNVERAAPVAEKYEIRKVTESFAEVCRRADIDVIDICTPPGFHFRQIQAALRAGKHVICEKPLVGSLAEVDSSCGSGEGMRPSGDAHFSISIWPRFAETQTPG